MNIATLRAVLLSSLTIAAADAAAPTGEERVTRSGSGFAREHGADELRDPLTFEEKRTPPERVVTKPRSKPSPSGPTIASVSFGDSWVYDASTEVLFDRDGDGYYHYLRVRFDVDTSHTVRYVYAVIFLSADGSAWEELYATDDFAVWGDSDDDDYEVETELVSGYSTGQYDVLIELYDADDGVLVDEFGPNESAEFQLLPLEDSVRDGVDAGPPPDSDDDGGGGATSWLMLAGLSALALCRRRVERADR
jgi:hypothetical protein